MTSRSITFTFTPHHTGGLTVEVAQEGYTRKQLEAHGAHDLAAALAHIAIRSNADDPGTVLTPLFAQAFKYADPEGHRIMGDDQR